MSPEVITSARWKTALVAVGGFAFVAIGAWMALESDDPLLKLIGALSGLFFLLCGAVGVISTIRPNRLLLDETGFTVVQCFRADYRVPWDDVVEFYVWRFRSNKLVAWTYKPGRSRPGLMQRLNSAIGVDGALPNGWRSLPNGSC